MSKCVAKFAHPPSWKPKSKSPKLKMHSSAALPQKFFVVDIYENFHLQSLISGGDPIPLKKTPLFGGPNELHVFTAKITNMYAESR